MSTQKRWNRGDFCWYELGTNDIDGAKRFYTSLFGWTTNDVPMGQMGIYSLFQHDGQDLGGMYKLEGPQFAGVPPNWAVYVAVDDVDADTAKARSLGATVLNEPMDVPNVGRISTIKDSQGAVISMYQAGDHPGAGRFENASNTFCWSELMTKDPAGSTKFYTALFGWGTNVKEGGPMKYTEWTTNGCSIGGMLQITPEMGGVPPHWMNYLSVADCDATVAKAKQLGGKVQLPPQDIPNVGRFSILADPQGAFFSVIKLTHK
ncbi:MAG TPA: VOC family protein [Candidatus Polarisedimenticolia bacterium]|nr:VOC family protein [Candidatus Polarisedimenticolia bacterium]